MCVMYIGDICAALVSLVTNRAALCPTPTHKPYTHADRNLAHSLLEPQRLLAPLLGQDTPQSQLAL